MPLRRVDLAHFKKFFKKFPNIPKKIAAAMPYTHSYK